MLIFDIVYRSLNGTTDSLDGTSQIVSRNTSSTKDVAVCEILGSQVTNWEFGQNYFGAGIDNLFQLFVNNGPFCINDCLVFLN